MQTPVSPTSEEFGQTFWLDSPQCEFPPTTLEEEEVEKKVPHRQRARFMCRNFWGCLPRLLVLPLIATLVIGVFLIGAGPLFAVYSQGDNIGTLAVFSNGTTQNTCPSDASGMGVTVQVTLVKAAESSAKATVSYLLSSDYARTIPSALNLPTGYSLTVVFNSVKKTYTSGDVLQMQDVTQALTPTSATSSYAYYPFDSYDASFILSTYLQHNTTVEAMPVCIQVGDFLPLFDSKINLLGAVYPEEVSDTIQGTSTLVVVTATYYRTATTKFFSIFIVLLMWALSAMVFSVAIDMIFIRPREPAPPAVGVFIATLFALPAVRNVQPDAPTIGARVDVVGFFWNMVLVGLATLVLLAGFVGFHKYGGRQTFKYV